MIEMSNGRDKNSNDREKSAAMLISIICYVVSAVAAAGLIGCIVAYALTKLDVLFIPLALCGVAAMISFTFARVKR